VKGQWKWVAVEAFSGVVIIVLIVASVLLGLWLAHHADTWFIDLAVVYLVVTGIAGMCKTVGWLLKKLGKKMKQLGEGT
jgi:hypothetical protein